MTREEFERIVKVDNEIQHLKSIQRNLSQIKRDGSKYLSMEFRTDGMGRLYLDEWFIKHIFGEAGPNSIIEKFVNSELKKSEELFEKLIS